MPRRSLDPAAKPFEVKVGLGFQAFGGMYRLGEPSMCPPNRFRRLINVRLGETDIRDRPGLNAPWDSGTGDPVVGMVEIKKGNAGKLWIGPNTWGVGPDEAREPWGAAAAATWSVPFYMAIDLDNTFPQVNDPNQAGKHLLFYLMTAIDNPLLLAGQNYEQAALNDRALCSISHFPYWACAPTIYGPTGKTLIGMYVPVYLSAAAGRPYGTAHGLGRADDFDFSHEHQLETVISNGGVNYWGLFPDEQQIGPCLDPPMLFRGKWIAPGSAIPNYLNPPVLGGSNTGAAGSGQQVFEILFDSGMAVPPSHLVTMVENGIDPMYEQWLEAGLANYFGGSLTELFRMPGVTVMTAPTRAAGGLDGKTIRSMSVLSVRADDPVSANEATDEKLYVGTHGGNPIAPAYWKAAGVEFVPPIHSLTNGEVYSFDGKEVKIETSGLGPNVIVCALPDGAVIACGRTAAKMFNPATGTWQAVAFATSYATQPRWYTVAPPVTYSVPGVADPDWKSVGFIWTDRVLFRGEAYFIGYDTARLCQRATTFPQMPPGPGLDYGATRDAWVLYRFNRATMQMVRMRGGEDIYTALRPTHWPAYPADPFATTGYVVKAFTAPCLAVWGEDLYYSWYQYPTKTYAGPTYGGSVGVGKFDGSSFDDDYVLHDFDRRETGVDPLYRVYGIIDMLGTSRGLFIALPGPANSTATNFGLLLWDGSAIVPLLRPANQWSIDTSFGSYGGRMFLGPS